MADEIRDNVTTLANMIKASAQQNEQSLVKFQKENRNFLGTALESFQNIIMTSQMQLLDNLGRMQKSQMEGMSKFITMPNETTATKSDEMIKKLGEISKLLEKSIGVDKDQLQFDKEQAMDKKQEEITKLTLKQRMKNFGQYSGISGGGTMFGMPLGGSKFLSRTLPLAVIATQVARIAQTALDPKRYSDERIEANIKAQMWDDKKGFFPNAINKIKYLLDPARIVEGVASVTRASNEMYNAVATEIDERTMRIRTEQKTGRNYSKTADKNLKSNLSFWDTAALYSVPGYRFVINEEKLNSKYTQEAKQRSKVMDIIRERIKTGTDTSEKTLKNIAEMYLESIGIDPKQSKNLHLLKLRIAREKFELNKSLLTEDELQTLTRKDVLGLSQKAFRFKFSNRMKQLGISEKTPDFRNIVYQDVLRRRRELVLGSGRVTPDTRNYKNETIQREKRQVERANLQKEREMKGKEKRGSEGGNVVVNNNNTVNQNAHSMDVTKLENNGSFMSVQQIMQGGITQ